MADRRWLRIALGLAAFGFSVRPSTLADDVAAWLASPLRLAAEVTYPLRLGLRGEVVAASRSLEQLQATDADEQRALREALDRAVRPTEEALVRERRFVFAEVEGPSGAEPDHLRAWVPIADGVEEGQPVIAGDAYVGRVASIQVLEGGEARIDVELVTARGFQVGARVEDGPAGAPVHMTVGGVRAEGETIDLAVHNPSNRRVDGGVARVFELIPDADPFAALGEGFVLGEIARHEATSEWSLQPELDYLDGLFQVMIVTPGSGGAEVAPYDPSLEARAWIPVRPLTMGDANPERSSLKLRKGSIAGLREGAAVTARGAHLVGRVGRVGPFTADVRLLDDPGLTLVALALLDGDPTPRPLGRLRSRGRDGDELIFRWSPRVALGEPGEAPVRARLFTGSGDRGMATGFPVGTTILPVATQVGDNVELRVVVDVDGRFASPLFVYAGTQREEVD